MSSRQDDLKKLEGLDDFIESTMKEWHVPGLALSIVKDGELLYSNAYGLRDPSKGLKMNTDTLCPIASNTKAFVALSLAILADEGKLDMDRPVRDYIPYFRLYDSYATQNVTPRDLLSHRTGLPGHDWALFHCKTRKEIVEGLRYLEPNYQIRTKQQYNNLMFLAAAHLVDVITDQPWESFVKERIFDKIEMENSNFSFGKSIQTGNFAECFYLNNGELRSYELTKYSDPEFINPRAPAGGMVSTVNEIVNWMLLQLNKGKFKGSRIASEKAFDEMHSIQMVDNWNTPYEEHGESGCSLGWFVWGYRGHKLVKHGGFFGSEICFMPKRNIGVAIFPTRKSPHTEVALMNIHDRLLGLDHINWNERMLRDSEEEEKRLQMAGPVRITGTKPSHALSDYCGVFAHPAFVPITVDATDSGLVAHLGENKLSLKHCHYDTFEALSPGGETEFRLTFQTDANGIIKSFTVPFEPEVNDIVFLRNM